MSVKVAVRVRPYLPREIDRNAVCCIDMVGNQTSITDVDSGNKRDFAFDYSFWSHDQFETTAEGMLVPVDDKYADQMKVYEALGKEVLDNAWNGYHCCLFAYGQTGAGKSYSMIGYGINKGIVPISANEIFERIKQNDNPYKKYEVTVSMLEIYNEKTQDLLIEAQKRPSAGLKIRENKTMGVYVEGLSKHPVDCYQAIEDKMEEGNKNRTIGSTLMNATSSRAHTIITIEFKQVEMINNRKSEKFSVINLVDLAGSEKAGQTGATGDRLKEGCAINKSLTVLGQVISVLADKSSGKEKGTVVPYRDSALTRILQNALGGNSKTIMICALSPASSNYEETLSTLRYADRAKRIQNKAVINESAQDKLIRELKEENEKLKAALTGGAGGTALGATLGIGMIQTTEQIDKIKELEEQLTANAAYLQDMEKSWQQRYEEEKEKELEKKKKQEVSIDKNKPHLINLNEDPQLSGKVLYDLTKLPVRVGRKNANPPPQIVLGALGIGKEHAIFDHDDEGNLTLSAVESSCGENIYVNGARLLDSVKVLKHKDRIIFGTNTIFVFMSPETHTDTNLPEDKEVDWELAQQEKVEVTDVAKKQEEMELERKIKEENDRRLKEMEAKLQHEKMLADMLIKQKQKEYEEKFKELQEKVQSESELANIEAARKEADAEIKEKYAEMEKMREDMEIERKREMERQEEVMKKQQQESMIEQKLSKLIPTVNETNLCAKELGRAFAFSIKLVSIIHDSMNLSPLERLKNKKVEIQIKVMNYEEGTTYFWNVDKFMNRLDMIKELVNIYYEKGSIDPIPKDDDPFWDPPEPVLVGQGYYNLKPLSYLIDNPCTITLIGGGKDEGQMGKLEIDIVPTDESGDYEPPEHLLTDDPKDLIGQRIDFIVEIKRASYLPDDCNRDTYVEYGFYLDEQKYKTELCPGKNANPEFSYKRHHTIDFVTENLLKHLMEGAICFKVYGYPESSFQNNSQPSSKIKTTTKKIEDKNYQSVPSAQTSYLSVPNPQKTVTTRSPTVYSKSPSLQVPSPQKPNLRSEHSMNDEDNTETISFDKTAIRERGSSVMLPGVSTLSGKQGIKQLKKGKGKYGKNGECTVF